MDGTHDLGPCPDHAFGAKEVSSTKRIQNPIQTLQTPCLSQSSSLLCSWLQWEFSCKAVVGVKKKEHLWVAVLALPPPLPLPLPPPLPPPVPPVAILEMLTNALRPMMQPRLLLLTLLPLVQLCRPMLLVSSTLPVVKTLAPDLDCKTPLIIWHRLVRGAMLWRVAPQPERLKRTKQQHPLSCSFYEGYVV